MKKIKFLIIFVLFVTLFTGTYCIFTKAVTKTGNIVTKELSAVFLDNSSFLDKIQVLDSSITSVDKTTDLNRVTTLPTVTFTSDNLFSTSSSIMPIYVWVDNGVINYYTGATSVDLNNASKSFIATNKDGSLSSGEELCITVTNSGNECFYVIDTNSTTTTLIAIYNLVVGEDYNENTGNYTPVSTTDPKYGLQGSTSVSINNIVGSSTEFSTQAYWAGNVGQGKTYPGVEYETSWGDIEYQQPYPYVYDSNSTIYSYIEDYVTVLKNNGAPSSTTGRLLEYGEVTAESSTIKNTYFWCGSAMAEGYVCYVNTNGRYQSFNYDMSGFAGVRPVIEVPTSSIDY